MSRQTDSQTRVTRRSLLAATAAGAALTAGCSNNDGDGGDGGGGDGGGGGGGDGGGGDGGGGGVNVVDKTWKDVTNIEPEQWNMNYWNPTNNAATDWGGNPMYDRFMRKVIHETDEPYFEWRIVSDMEWQDDNGTLVLKIDNGHVWHDGDPVTARDVATQLRIGKYDNSVLWDFINELTVEDDATLEIDVGEVSPPILEDIIAEQRLYAKHSVFKSWLEDLRNAGSSEEEDEIVAELLDYSISPTSDEAVGNGPFMIGDVTAERVRYDRWDQYPWAENVNFAHQTYRTILEKSGVVQSLNSGDLSGHHFTYFTDETRGTLPDEIKYVKVPDNGGYAMDYNSDSEHLGDPRVHRAIAHLIDRQAIVENITANFVTPYPSGLASDLGMVEQVAGDYMDSFDQYSPESTDEEAAAEELRAAGYEKDGDQWVDEDGNQLTADVLSASWGTISTIAETINTQLTRAGIASELQIIEPGTFFQRFEDGDYDLRVAWWGGGAEQTSPWFSLRVPFTQTHQREELAFPETTEIAWPPDSQDETQEINVQDAVAELGSTTDADLSDELALQLAWTWNQQLPKLPLTERWTTPYVNTGEWETPEDQDQSTRALETDEPLAYLLTVGEWWPRAGLLQAPE
ncbi:ABC transporter substrate-binding protein [Halosimplex sp. TS25]|uniref:ABC transporter substrate-binding protein n=1 Tax=Halosimplex rarum TaxID=3396619 RepID=UPI0039EAA931